jgi:hypothetical protein
MAPLLCDRSVSPTLCLGLVARASDARRQHDEAVVIGEILTFVRRAAYRVANDDDAVSDIDRSLEISERPD